MVKKHVTFAYPLVTFCTAPLILSTPTSNPFSKEKSSSSPTDKVDSSLKPVPEKAVASIPKPAPENKQVHSLPKPRPSTNALSSYLPDETSLAKLTRKVAGDMVRIKAILGGDVRRFSIDEPSFATLHEHIRSSYSIPHIAIKYRDEEGDFVTLSSDAELVDAVAIAEGNGGLLRLILHPSPISAYPYSQVPPPRLAPLRHSYPYHHRSPPPPPRRHTPPPPQPRHVPHPSPQSRHGRVPPMYPPPPPQNMYPGDIEQSTDRMLDSVLGAVSWLLLGCVLYNGIPLYNTLLLVGFVSLHRRLLIRPFIKRNVIAMIQARRLAPRPPPPHAPPHTPYALHPHAPHPH